MEKFLHVAELNMGETQVSDTTGCAGVSAYRQMSSQWINSFIDDWQRKPVRNLESKYVQRRKIKTVVKKRKY